MRKTIRMNIFPRVLYMLHYKDKGVLANYLFGSLKDAKSDLKILKGELPVIFDVYVYGNEEYLEEFKVTDISDLVIVEYLPTEVT